MSEVLSRIDPEIFKLIKSEKFRIKNCINLIASENYTYKAVMQASGSILSSKYAEGYPKKRYYSGCKNVDSIEIIAQNRCKEIFGSEHVNVQPHSGSQANMAVYLALLNFGDTILSMELSSGGHLSHGYDLNLSGKLYKSIFYHVDKNTELIDYQEVEDLAKKHRPKLIISGSSSYSRIIDFKKFKEIADSVGACFMVDMAHIAGLVASKLHPSPIEYADIVTSTTHKTLRGPRGGLILCKNEFAKKIDKAVMPGVQGGPFMNQIAAKAVGFKYALMPDFIEYQKNILINAKALSLEFIKLGYKIVSNGTDNHMFIINLTDKNISGKFAEEILEKNNIYVNRNTIPFDTKSPLTSSGIRLGTPAITSRGFKKIDMVEIAKKIDKIISKC